MATTTNDESSPRSCCAVDIDGGNDRDDDEEGWDGVDGDYDERRVVVMLIVVPLTLMTATNDKSLSCCRRHARCRAIDVDRGNNSNDDKEGWDGGDGNYDERRVIVMLIVMPLTLMTATNDELPSCCHCHSRCHAIDIDGGNDSNDNDDEEEWDGGDGDGNYDKQWVIIMLIIVLLTGGERAP